MTVDIITQKIALQRGGRLGGRQGLGVWKWGVGEGRQITGVGIGGWVGRRENAGR